LDRLRKQALYVAVKQTIWRF